MWTGRACPVEIGRLPPVAGRWNVSYVQGLLGGGERIVITARRHWFFLVGRIALYILAALVLVAAGVLLATQVSQIVGLIVGLLAIVPAVFAAIRYLQWHHEEYVVTNHRIIQIEGILSKRVLDSSLEKVNDILLSQSVFGRMFDYGTLEILTASEMGVNRLDALAQPFRFKRAILDARNQPDTFRDERPRVPDETVRLLAALNDLRNSGVLSEAEYREKRERLVGDTTTPATG